MFGLDESIESDSIYLERKVKWVKQSKGVRKTGITRLYTENGFDPFSFSLLFLENKMDVGKTYDVAFSTGRYEIEYERGVKCIKQTPKSYRVERMDGTTRLIGQDSIIKLELVNPWSK